MLVMTPSEYTASLSSLGMDNKAAAEWLGISLRTQQRYARSGPCGMARRAVRSELEFYKLKTMVDDGTLEMLIAKRIEEMDK